MTWETAAFAAVLLLGFVIVMIETRGLSPYADDWEFIVHRRGLSATTLLTPHGPHLSLFPILIYKVWLSVFGASTYLWFRILAGLDMILLGLTLGWITRRIWGGWWGLLPVVLLVTLGPGGESLIWSFQVGYTLATCAGLAAVYLTASYEVRRRNNLLILGLLLVSLGSSSQGVGFIVGVVLVFLLRRRAVRDWWVVLIPAALYILWYLKYGRPASETELSLWPSALGYVFQSVSATLPNFLGLSNLSTGQLDTTYGVPLVVLAVGGAGFALRRGWRPPALLWGVLISGVVLWVASALSNFGPYTRAATDPRYLETNAMVLLPVLVAAIPRPRIPRAGILAVGVVLLIVALTNSDQYNVERGTMYASDVDSRAELGALKLMEGIAPPTFTPAFPGDPGVLVWVTEAGFTSADRSFGLQYDTIAQLRRQPSNVQVLVDEDLSAGELRLSSASDARGPYGPTPQVIAGATSTSRGCVAIGTVAPELRLAPARYQLTAGPEFPMSIIAGRFDPTPTAPVGSVAAGATDVLTIPQDDASVIPWHFAFTGTGARICALR